MRFLIPVKDAWVSAVHRNRHNQPQCAEEPSMTAYLSSLPVMIFAFMVVAFMAVMLGVTITDALKKD